MGHLKNGQWHNDEVATSDDSGNFKREESTFRNFIGKDLEFKPEKDRYHLYVSYACPWAHRTLIARKLKRMEDLISVSVVHPDMLEHSWTFKTDFNETTGDDLYNLNYLYEVYKKDNPEVTCKVTVPVLWDKKTHKIVNNESSEIIRIFNTAFNDIGANDLDLYPEKHRAEIDEINELVYVNINNGVYKTGFAKTQNAYEHSYKKLFKALDEVDQKLKGKNFLVGEVITEADIRLVTTLLRFDSVYHTHFKCNARLIKDYEYLSHYLKNLFEMEPIRSTTHLDHIKRHYYYSHDFLNPNRIVALGPEKLFS